MNKGRENTTISTGLGTACGGGDRGQRGDR